MSRSLMIPPNFVTLRHLKELKEKLEEEERLKKEEEELLRKLKEEEEERERLREDRLRKLKEEEESRKNPSAKTLESKGPYRDKWRGGGLRRGVNPDARPSRGGANIESQVASNGGSGDRGSSSGANFEAEVALGNGRSAVKASTAEELKKKKKKKKWKKKNSGKMKEKMAEMPLGLNGSDEGRKGFGSQAGANGFEKEKKSTNVTRKGNGSDKKFSGGVSYPPVKVIGSESGPMVADIVKRVSDLKMVGRNPNPRRRGRSYWAAPSGRGGGGSGSVMMWVKKTTTEA